MMDIIPAIDLIEGSVIRLVKGDFAQKTVYSNDPVSVALSFKDAGFRRLHIVDLDGARKGEPVHIDLLAEICRHTDLQIDFGGGIRTRDQVETILSAGARQISIGSMAITEPEKVEKWIREFGAHSVFLGADVKDGLIATHAWTQLSSLSIVDFITYWREKGICDYFCTDIGRDGKLKGPAIELYSSLLAEFKDINLVASGGVSGMDELKDLAATGVSAVIIGKAFYEGYIDIDELKPWINNAG